MRILKLALGVTIGLGLLPVTALAQDAAAVAEGAQLYGQNCVRCHTARSPMERTDREWVTIVNHMRARANLRKSEAQAMIAFLQATNGMEAPGTPARAEVRSVEGDREQTSLLLGISDLADPELSPELRRAVERYLLELLRDR